VFASRQRENANAMISRNSKEMNMFFSKAIANTYRTKQRIANPHRANTRISRNSKE
jgi:hypothetical protein